MHRRQFLAYGSASLIWPLSGGIAHARAYPADLDYEISIEPADVELIDGTIVYQIIFYEGSKPRPVLRATEGDRVTISVTNHAPEPHGFAVPGIAQSVIGPIAPKATRSATFIVPRGGTYMYQDPTNAPVNRLLGLHGAFVVDPLDGRTPAGSFTPYSRGSQTPALQHLFDALGKPGKFPGQQWDPHDEKRQRLWLFNQIDPRMNARADKGEVVDGRWVTANFRPRYFTINGRSGYDLHSDESVTAKGYIGEPAVIRILNAGLATHSPHIHGNHVFVLSRTGPDGSVVVLDNILEHDTWSVPPLARLDILLPFKVPPDIPAAAWPPRQEPFPLKYAMHCHTEMSQTAGGGNYPQGAVVEWQILGPRRH